MAEEREGEPHIYLISKSHSELKKRADLSYGGCGRGGGQADAKAS